MPNPRDATRFQGGERQRNQGPSRAKYLGRRGPLHCFRDS